jgi:hypothetical protein
VDGFQRFPDLVAEPPRRWKAETAAAKPELAVTFALKKQIVGLPEFAQNQAFFPGCPCSFLREIVLLARKLNRFLHQGLALRQSRSAGIRLKVQPSPPFCQQLGVALCSPKKHRRFPAAETQAESVILVRK